MKVSAGASSVVAATAKAELELNGGLVLRPDITRNLFCRVMVNEVKYLASKIAICSWLSGLMGGHALVTFSEKVTNPNEVNT